MWLYPDDFRSPSYEPDWNPEWDFNEEDYPEAQEDGGTFVAENGEVLLGSLGALPFIAL